MIIFVDHVDGKLKWLTILFRQKLIGRNGSKKKTYSHCVTNATTEKRKESKRKSPTSKNGGGEESAEERGAYTLLKISLFLNFLVGGANLWRADRKNYY